MSKMLGQGSTVEIEASTAELQEVLGALVSADFFAVLGVKPILGRGFLPEDDITCPSCPAQRRPGATSVAVLGHGLWQRAFGADPSLLGRTLRLGGMPYTVIGIMPQGFKFPHGAEVWLPLAIDSRSGDERWTRKNFSAIARLKSGVRVERAKSDLAVIAAREAQTVPNQRGWGVEVMSVDDFLFWSARPALLALLGAVSFVLLVVCANVASLNFVRMIARRREIAIRIALGAGRISLIRQSLAESAVLSIGAGAAGLLVLQAGQPLMNAILPGSLPRADDVLVDWGVLAFTLLTSLLISVVVGLLPALQTARGDLTEPLKEGSRGAGAGPGSRRIRGALAGAQIALALLAACIGHLHRPPAAAKPATAGRRVGPPLPNERRSRFPGNHCPGSAGRQPQDFGMT